MVQDGGFKAPSEVYNSALPNVTSRQEHKVGVRVGCGTSSASSATGDLNDTAILHYNDRSAIARSTFFSSKIPESNSGAILDKKRQLYSSMQGDFIASPSRKRSRSLSGLDQTNDRGSDWVFNIFTKDDNKTESDSSSSDIKGDISGQLDSPGTWRRCLFKSYSLNSIDRTLELQFQIDKQKKGLILHINDIKNFDNYGIYFQHLTCRDCVLYNPFSCDKFAQPRYRSD
jgi:hypothetical protein